MTGSVIVIGGGIAGLTAAYRLQQAGVPVTVLEKSDRLGGVMYSLSVDGYLMEAGPNTILETSAKVTDLVTDIGLDSEKVYAGNKGKNRYIVRDQKPICLPLSPPAFFTSPLFSLRAKLRLLKEPFIEPWDNSYEESLSQFVLRRLGRELLDYAINPFVAGVYAGDPDFLSVKHGFPKLYALEQTYGSLIKGQIKGAKERKRRREASKPASDMFSFTRGLTMVPDRLGELLGDAVRKKTVANNITRHDRRWKVQFEDSKGKHGTFTSHAVLFAGRAFDLPRLKLDNTQKEQFVRFEKIYHPPVSVLALGFKREDVGHFLNGFGVLVPKIENFQILGVLFSSSLFENRAPKGHVLLTVFIGGTRNPDVALKPPAELVDLALNDIGVILDVKARPTFVHHICWEKAIPQYQVGYEEYRDILASLERDYPGLFFTGNYCSGISVADTIAHATDTSYRIQNYLTEQKGETS